MAEFNRPVQRNTVHDKGEDALESGEKLRLIYRTGTENVNALPDPHAFTGGLNNLTIQEIRALERDERSQP